MGATRDVRPWPPHGRRTDDLRIAFLNRSFWPDVESTGQLLTELCQDLAVRHDVTVIAGRSYHGSRSPVSWPVELEHLPARPRSGGATADDVALMRQTVGPNIGVKAAGGIRNAEVAKTMIEAGATRLGASASVAIVRGGSGSGSY